MRKLLMLLLCLFWAAPAIALIDHFDDSHDFVADGVAGTDWDEAYYSGGTSIQILSGGGNLRIQSQDTTAGGWEGVWDLNDDGIPDVSPMLLTEQTGDFVMITRFSDINALNVFHQGAGLIARNPDTSAGENLVQSAFFSVWTGHIAWNIVNGTRTAEAGATGLDVYQYCFMKLERIDDHFYPYVSEDGVNWVAMFDGWTREDMPETLQVGLFQTTFTENLGWTEFDFLYAGRQVASLSPANVTVKEEGETKATMTITLTGPTPEADVYVDVIPYAIPYKMIQFPDANDPNDIRLIGSEGPQEKGKPLTLHFPVGTTQKTFEVQAVDDDLIEGIEYIGLKVLTYSEDEAYNQQLGQWGMVTVIDSDQGYLAIDDGEGVVVDENQTMIGEFTVALPAQPTDDVVVTITTPDGQTTVNPDTLVFTPENYDQPQVVFVTAVDDDILETDPHTGSIQFAVTSDDLFYTGIVTPPLTVTIYENQCGAWGYSRFDFNQDCVVDMQDLAIVASQWMLCTLPHVEGCLDVR